MATVYRRARSRFKSARAAWKDVAAKTGIRPASVVSDHTGTHWVFKHKPGARPVMPRRRRMGARM